MQVGWRDRRIEIAFGWNCRYSFERSIVEEQMHYFY